MNEDQRSGLSRHAHTPKPAAELPIMANNARGERTRSCQGGSAEAGAFIVPNPGGPLRRWPLSEWRVIREQSDAGAHERAESKPRNRAGCPGLFFGAAVGQP
jgi:hypothetical protein